ncbi:MAG: tryptophan-rich sensory protein [Cyclobacteriaceae bacterium]|nr:tryptophan-rich sensory protein [Cyclobacteriaceae bacterium]
MNTKFLAVANTLTLMGVLLVNALANILPINGMNTGEISALYPSLFTPAGLTFSIWSVIYLLLIGFVFVQWKIKNKSWFKELSVWFILSSLANISWILVWHNLYVYASVVIMLLILYTLARIFLLLQKESFTSLEFTFVKLPFTIYFSWICVATIANISTLLISLPWYGGPFTEETWTLIMLVIASTLSVFVSVKFNAFGYILVTIWALYGIYLRWNGGEHQTIATTSMALAAILVIVFIYTLFRKENRVVN